MEGKNTRSSLEKDFFAGRINEEEFQAKLLLGTKHQGYHFKPGKKPKRSGPLRDTVKEANEDNLPYWKQGFSVGVYHIQQKRF